MENQVEQLKLNVTNIKSVLINSNAKLKKINSQKSSIVRTEAQKEKKAAKKKYRVCKSAWIWNHWWCGW